MTHTTNVYMTAAYIGIRLLSLLAYYRGYLRVKGFLYHRIFEYKSISFLPEKFVAKLSDIILNFPVSWKGNYPKNFRQHTNMQFSRKKMTFLLSSIWGNVDTLQTAHWNFVILCHMGFLILILYQLKKQETKEWSKNVETVGWYCYSWACLICYTNKQSSIIKYK